MTVYCVFGYVRYRGRKLIAIFNSEELAEKKVLEYNEERPEAHFYVVSYTVKED